MAEMIYKARMLLSQGQTVSFRWISCHHPMECPHANRPAVWAFILRQIEHLPMYYAGPEQ